MDWRMLTSFKFFHSLSKIYSKTRAKWQLHKGQIENATIPFRGWRGKRAEEPFSLFNYLTQLGKHENNLSRQKDICITLQHTGWRPYGSRGGVCCRYTSGVNRKPSGTGFAFWSFAMSNELRIACVEKKHELDAIVLFFFFFVISTKFSKRWNKIIKKSQQKTLEGGNEHNPNTNVAHFSVLFFFTDHWHLQRSLFYFFIFFIYLEKKDIVTKVCDGKVMIRNTYKERERERENLISFFMTKSTFLASP